VLGFASLGKLALGQVGLLNNPIVIGVFGTGVAGVVGPSTGSVPGVFGTGVAGIIIPSTLSINPRRLLGNVVRRLRTIGRFAASPHF
jgi:hypothetical protein